MGNDLEDFRPIYLKIREDMERLSSALKPAYLSIYEQMERALEPIRRHHLDIIRAVEHSGLVSSRLADIAHANHRWQELIDQAMATNRVFEDFKGMHHTWMDAFKPMQDSFAQLQARAKLSLCDVTHRLTVTERLFAGIDFESLRRAIALPEPVIPSLENAIRDVTFTYENLATSIRTLPEIARLPAFALTSATRELFTTGYAINSICISDKPGARRDSAEVQLVAETEQETSNCVALLQTVDPALARPYIGARDALRGKNTDRARHILTSLRELWNHLLRRLAPDEPVMMWVPKDDRELLHNGRPTRKARVLYVCRNLNYEPLTDFVVQATRALVKLVDFFNRVHELDPELTDEQLRALLLRTDSWLMYILQIWEGEK